MNEATCPECGAPVTWSHGETSGLEYDVRHCTECEFVGEPE